MFSSGPSYVLLAAPTAPHRQVALASVPKRPLSPFPACIRIRPSHPSRVPEHSFTLGPGHQHLSCSALRQDLAPSSPTRPGTTGVTPRPRAPFPARSRPWLRSGATGSECAVGIATHLRPKAAGVGVRWLVLETSVTAKALPNPSHQRQKKKNTEARRGAEPGSRCTAGRSHPGSSLGVAPNPSPIWGPSTPPPSFPHRERFEVLLSKSGSVLSCRVPGWRDYGDACPCECMHECLHVCVCMF